MMSGLAKGLLTGFGISAVGFYFYKKKTNRKSIHSCAGMGSRCRIAGN